MDYGTTDVSKLFLSATSDILLPPESDSACVCVCVCVCVYVCQQRCE